jgi:hypothetical protein
MTVAPKNYQNWSRHINPAYRRLVTQVALSPAILHGHKRRLFMAYSTSTVKLLAAWFDPGSHKLTLFNTQTDVGWFGRILGQEFIILSPDYPGISPSLKYPAAAGTAMERSSINLWPYISIETFLIQAITKGLPVAMVSTVAEGTVGAAQPYTGWSELGFTSGGTRSVDGMTANANLLPAEGVWVYATKERELPNDPVFSHEKRVFQVTFSPSTVAGSKTYRKSKDSRVNAKTNLSGFISAIQQRELNGDSVAEAIWGTVRYVRTEVWNAWINGI